MVWIRIGIEEFRRLQDTILRRECVEAGYEYTSVSESDDIGPTVSVDIGKRADMFLRSPSSFAVSVIADRPDRRDQSIAQTIIVGILRVGDPDSVISESDHIGTPVAVDVFDESRVPEILPAAISLYETL